MTSTIGFEECVDDGPFDEAAWSTDGHHEPSRALLMSLARAVHYSTGYDRREVVGLMRTVKWHKGFVGEDRGRSYDWLPCDEEGTAQTVYDDDGEEVVLSNVKPCTWGIVKLD